MTWHIIHKHAKLLLAIYWRRLKRFLGKNELEELEKWYENEYYTKTQTTRQPITQIKVKYIEFNWEWAKEILDYMKLIGFAGGLVFGFPIVMLLMENKIHAIPILILWTGVSILTYHSDKKIEIEQEIQKWESEHNDENKEIVNKLPRTPIHRGRLEFIKEKTHETEQEKAMHK